jgi:hypothetical protein
MPANRLRRSLTTTIVVPAILMALATIALLWQLDRQILENDWVEHTDRVMLLAETAKAEFLSAQTALRGFLLSDPINHDLTSNIGTRARKSSRTSARSLSTIPARNSG